MGVDKKRMGSRPCCKFNLGHEEKRVRGKGRERGGRGMRCGEGKEEREEGREGREEGEE